MLATSREALGVEGERILPVPPLPVEDATALFAERAKAGRPDFDLDHEPVGAVAEICRRLDGLPLAIELAAARMRAMSSLDVARRLDRLRLLSGGARDAPPRQQSLVATIDWSYRLLTDAEQALFMRLSVFAGGFDLEAAHGVCGADGATEDDTLELLTGLLDKSMVKMRPAPTGPDTSCWRRCVHTAVIGCGRTALTMSRNRGMRSTTPTLPSAPRSACTVPTRGPGSSGCCPITTTCASHSSMSSPTATSIPRFGWSLAVRIRASANRLRVVRLGGADGRAGRARPPAVRRRRRFRRPGSVEQGRVRPGAFVAMLAQGRAPGRGNGRVAYPGDVLADLALYEGDADAALAHYEAEMARARGDDDPIRLVWTLFYVAICHAALRAPETVWPPRRRPSRSPTRRPTRRRGRWRATRLAWC